MASVSYSRIVWAGVALIMENGSRQALEFHHPHEAKLTFISGIWVVGGPPLDWSGEKEIEQRETSILISGHGVDWAYWNKDKETAPFTQSLGSSALEIERG